MTLKSLLKHLCEIHVGGGGLVVSSQVSSSGTFCSFISWSPEVPDPWAEGEMLCLMARICTQWLHQVSQLPGLGGGLDSYLSGGWPSMIGSWREGDSSPLAQKRL